MIGVNIKNVMSLKVHEVGWPTRAIHLLPIILAISLDSMWYYTFHLGIVEYVVWYKMCDLKCQIKLLEEQLKTVVSNFSFFNVQDVTCVPPPLKCYFSYGVRGMMLEPWQGTPLDELPVSTLLKGGSILMVSWHLLLLPAHLLNFVSTSSGEPCASEPGALQTELKLPPWYMLPFSKNVIKNVIKMLFLST